jgi:hypothetical protein
MTSIMSAPAASIMSDPILAKHVAKIRNLGKRVVADIIEIGRRLTKCKGIVGHGNWEIFLAQELGWSDRTALNFMRVFDLAEAKSENFSVLNLPVSSLYLLAAPSTPKEARTEIIQRAEAGEKVSGAEVKETIARVKRKGDTAETAQVTPSDTAETETAQMTPSDTAETETAQVTQDGTADTAAQDDVVASAEAPETAPPAEPEADPAAPELAPNLVATAAAAVNRLSGTELRDFLDRLWPAPVRAFELKFGARKSDNTNAEIARLANECRVLLARAEQNAGDIHQKLARIRKLAGDKTRANTSPRTSNAQLDRGAFARGMGVAGPTDQKFTKMQMEPTGTDASGNPVFAQSRGNRSRAY